MEGTRYRVKKKDEIKNNLQDQEKFVTVHGDQAAKEKLELDWAKEISGKREGATL